MFIDRVFKEDGFAGVIVVQDMNGAQIRYLMKDGVLYPGRVWRSSFSDREAGGPCNVTFFIPFPDGTPEVLKVEAL